MMEQAETATLLVSCRDRSGLVAALSDFVFRHDGNILDADQHSEAQSGLFLMRLVWDTRGFKLDRTATQKTLAELAQPFGLTWQLSYSDRKPRVAVFSGPTHHCLYDLLLNWQLGELQGEIAMVISNHPETADVCKHFGVPFTLISVVNGDKATAEAKQKAMLTDLEIDLVVLARYMQILSPAFVSDWLGRMINIHHSFLPAFVGAKPYHQAKERGVKIIGATAHYVTSELDQGPIIDQDVCRVSHRDEVQDLVRKGRDLERQVLTRAVRLHLERRVLVSGNRTVVFS